MMRNPVPHNFADLPKSRQREILQEHETTLDDMEYFNKASPNNPPYSDKQILAAQNDVKKMRALMSDVVPMPEAPVYRDLPEYKWQDAIIRLKDNIEVLEGQMDHIRYEERDMRAVNRLKKKRQTYEIEIDYFQTQIHNIGELRKELQKVRGQLAKIEDDPAKAYEIPALNERIESIESDIDSIIRETNRRLK